MGLWPWTDQCLPHALPLVILVMLILVSSSSSITAITTSQKVEQSLVPPVPDPSIKCMACPCNPCAQHSPPPPPPPPSTQNCGQPQQQVPPPPRFIYITEPPPPRFTYITSEPGSLYATDPTNLGFYSAAGRNVLVGFVVLVACGVLEVLIAFW